MSTFGERVFEARAMSADRPAASDLVAFGLAVFGALSALGVTVSLLLRAGGVL